jgi:uncharacterized protein YacL
MITVLRLSVVIVFVLGGYLIGLDMEQTAVGVALGLVLGLVAVFLERIIGKLSLGSVIGGLLGLAIGLLCAKLLLIPIAGIVATGYGAAAFFMSALFGYGGLLVGLDRGRNLTVGGLARVIRGQEAEESLKILDTSVIIDGRIADVCDTGFVEGTFVVPQFILHELQHIADSPDSLKRARGRRGLDILQRVQKIPHITVRIVEDDFPKIREVDAKLVALGKALGAKVVTNDFNLNKVAELQGVTVLNINELSNAIKPVVLPGEGLKVFVIKEGKEQNQGVAYLDDGTMVVIDGGRRLIGKNVEVTVTSVLQTTAGRMIFTKMRDESEAR